MFDKESLKKEIERTEEWYKENMPECPKRYMQTLLKVTVTKDEVKEPAPGKKLVIKGLGSGFIMTTIPDGDNVVIFARFNLTSIKKLLTKLTRPS